jgi:phage recombination protein Bet
MAEKELIEVLRNSLYPGAQDVSIKMVIGYCKASHLDPMQKPVHIVPMKVSSGKKDNYGNDIKEMRDVIMPGVGLYRINASRTGQYAGVGEPEYGPTKILQFKKDQWSQGGNGKRVKTVVDASMEYPEWCRVTVEKLVDGEVRQFTAREYWLENYAEKGDFGAPNSMWAKRPFGQIAKCAEAQALRKAFPECGSQPTADEMEGKELFMERDITPAAGEQTTATTETVNQAAGDEQPKEETTALPDYPADKFEASAPAWRKSFESGTSNAEHLISMISSRYTLSPKQLEQIRALVPIEGTVEE